MKLRATKNGFSLHFSKCEWSWFKHLICKVWDNYDVSDDDAAYTVLSDLRDIV